MRSEEIIEVFNGLFRADERTELVGGGAEPLYAPYRSGCHQIAFRADFAASALHEVAHWCIAGPERRQLVDYGYSYHPEGRTPTQQEEFEAFEVKPQALEWLFASAAGVMFYVSIDNLQGAPCDPLRFRRRIRDQALHYLAAGLPKRAEIFYRELQRASGRSEEVSRFWRRVAAEGLLPD